MARITAVIDSAKVSSETATSATVYGKGHLKYGSSTHGYICSGYCSVNGSKTSFSGKSINTVGGTFASTTKSLSITKTHSSQSIPVKMYGKVTSTGETASKTVNVTVKAKTSYKVYRNGNGNGGTYSALTKWYGESLSLGTPTWENHTFKGWSTNSKATSGELGTTYTANAEKTVYAIWQINTFTITYDAGGGTGTMASQTIDGSGTLNSCTFTRQYYTFTGWKDENGVNYSNNQAVAGLGNKTLYAQWELTYRRPTIDRNKTDCVRASSNGTENVDGTYIKIKLTYVPNDMVENATLSVKVDGSSVSIKKIGASSFANSISLAKSQTTAEILINKSCSTGNSFNVEITLTSAELGLTDVFTDVVSPSSTIIDISADGNTIAFGCQGVELQLNGTTVECSVTTVTVTGGASTTDGKLAQAIANAFSYADAKDILGI